MLHNVSETFAIVHILKVQIHYIREECLGLSDSQPALLFHVGLVIVFFNVAEPTFTVV